MLKELISKAWAEILAIRYNASIKYHYINRKGYWEFEIKDIRDFDFYEASTTIYYKTKGLR